MSGGIRSFVLAALLASLCGCASMSKPMSAGFASVVIRGATEEQVREETAKVFAAEEWRGGYGSGNEMIFEREGSKWDHVAYGSNVLDSPVLNRVKAGIVPLADGSLRLQCQAYAVRVRGSARMDEEIKLHAPRAGPYQQLLDKVAAHFMGQEKK